MEVNEKQEANPDPQKKDDLPVLDLFSTLPDEILEDILVQLTDSKDLANVAEASRNCEVLLRPTKLLWMFHKVLPDIVKYLPLNALLHLRLVCKEWKKCVEPILEDVALASVHQQRKECQFHASDSATITNFIANMNPHFMTDKNPFVGRRILLGKMYFQSIDPVYWSHSLNLLKMFGSHIWHCTLDVEDTEVNFMFLLHGILKRLPNLKFLRIFHNDWRVGTYRQHRINNLIQYYQRHPLPDFLHFEHLSVLNAPSQFFNLVLPKYIGGLKSLILECYLPLDLRPQHETVISTVEKLTFLKLLVLDCDDIKTLLPKRSPIESLILDLSSTGKFNFDEVIDLIACCYRETLITLEIYLGESMKCVYTPTLIQVQTMLPKLLKLKIKK